MTEVTLMQIIGNNIKELLDEYPMTQKELAEIIHLDKSTISRYTNGEAMPSLKNLLNIVYALNCDITDIVDVYGRIE